MQLIYITYDIVSSRIYNVYYERPNWYPAVLDNVFIKKSKLPVQGCPSDNLTSERSADVIFSPGDHSEFFILNSAKYDLLEFCKFEVDKSVIINTQMPYGGGYKIHEDFDEQISKIYNENYKLRIREAQELFNSACWKICSAQNVKEVQKLRVFYESLFLKDLA